MESDINHQLGYNHLAGFLTKYMLANSTRNWTDLPASSLPIKIVLHIRSYLRRIVCTNEYNVAKNLILEYRLFLPNRTQSPLDTCMHRFQLLLELLQCPKRPNHSVNSSSRQQWEKRRIKETNNQLGSQMEGLRIPTPQQTSWRF